MKYLIDTDIWSLWVLRSQSVTDNASRHSVDDVSISIVTVTEVLEGWIKRIKHAPQLKLVGLYASMLRSFTSMRHIAVLPFSDVALQHYQRTRQQYKGRDPFDLQIAAIALSRKLILVTNNTKDYEDIDGLKLENWNRPSS